MKNTEKNQTGATAPVQLSLESGAFYAALTPIIGVNRVGWPNDDHLRFVEALLGRLVDQQGQSPSLNERIRDIIRLVFRPTEDAQKRVLWNEFREAGYDVDDATKKAFELLLSAAQFADFLAKTDNPATKAKFITKAKSRGVKKSTLDSLIGDAPAVRDVTKSVHDEPNGKQPSDQQPTPEGNSQADSQAAGTSEDGRQ